MTFERLVRDLLRKLLRIDVFHDDSHDFLLLVNKDFVGVDDVRVVQLLQGQILVLHLTKWSVQWDKLIIPSGCSRPQAWCRF